MVDKLEGVTLAAAEVLVDLCIKAKSSLENDFELCQSAGCFAGLYAPGDPSWANKIATNTIFCQPNPVSCVEGGVKRHF